MTRDFKYVKVGEESVFGIEVAGQETIPAIDVTPATNPTYSDQETIAASYLKCSNLTSSAISLDFSFYPSLEHGLARIIKWLLGAPTTAQQGATIAYLHTYLSDDVLKSFTALIGSKDLTEEPYLGMVMRSLELGSDPGSYLMATVGAYGKEKGADNPLATPSFSAICGLQHSDLAVTIDTVAKSSKIGAVSITVNNNLREDTFTAGDTLLQNQPKHTRRRVEGSIELPEYDSALRTAFEDDTTVALVFTWTGAEIAAPYNYQLKVTIPKAVINSYAHPITGRDIETHTFGWFALYDSGEDTEIKVELINTDTSL